MILEILLISTLPACVAPWLQEPLRGNKELNAVLEAYKKQNTELTARRDETASQGVRQLAITNEAGSAEPLVMAELRTPGIGARTMAGSWRLHPSIPGLNCTQRFQHRT